jgi:phosphonate transport system permease protein
MSSTVIDTPFRFRNRRSLARHLVLAVGLAAVAASAFAAGVGRGAVVNLDGWPLAQRFFVAAAHPRVDATFLRLTWDSTVTTVAYAALGTTLALAIGFLSAPFVSQIWWRDGRFGRRGWVAAWLVSRTALVVPRGIHEVIWGLFLLNILGIDPLVAVLAIGIPFGAVTAKVYSEILDETDRHAYSALRAAGAGRLSAFAYGLLPEAMPDLISYGFYRFECAIRAAAILGLVGAGGLGFQIALSFQSLHYDEMWTFLYALIALSGAADLWSSLVRGRGKPSGAAATIVRPRRDRVLTASVAAAVALAGFSAWWIKLNPTTLGSPRTLHLLAGVVGQAFPPTLGGQTIGGLIRLSADTLAMSVLAGAFAFVAALGLAYPAAWIGQARSSPARRGLRVFRVALTRLVLLVCRAIPPPVWALIFLFVLFPGILPGALALGVYNAGVVGRLCAEAAENVAGRPAQALQACGVPAAQTFLYATLPATFGRFVSYAFYRWEVAVRETIVVGVVGAGGLGLLLKQQLAGFDYAAVITTLIALIILTLLVDLASAAARRALTGTSAS